MWFAFIVRGLKQHLSISEPARCINSSLCRNDATNSATRFWRIPYPARD